MKSGFKIILPEDFMRHFRWITPLLLLLLNLIAFLLMYMGKEFLTDFKDMRTDIVNLKAEVSGIKGYLSNEKNR